MRDSSSVLSHLKLYMLSKKETHQSANYQTLTARMKINQIRYVIFQATSQFSFKFRNTFHCHDTKIL